MSFQYLRGVKFHFQAISMVYHSKSPIVTRGMGLDMGETQDGKKIVAKSELFGGESLRPDVCGTHSLGPVLEIGCNGVLKLCRR